MNILGAVIFLIVVLLLAGVVAYVAFHKEKEPEKKPISEPELDSKEEEIECEDCRPCEDCKPVERYEPVTCLRIEADNSRLITSGELCTRSLGAWCIYIGSADKFEWALVKGSEVIELVGDKDYIKNIGNFKAGYSLRCKLTGSNVAECMRPIF